jgi:hypothetical protein
MTRIVRIAPTVHALAVAYRAKAFYRHPGALMNTKIAVPLIAAVALVAACNKREDAAPPSNTATPSDTTSSPGDQSATPGGTAGETPATPPPADNATPPTDTPPSTDTPPPNDTPPPKQ